MRDFLTQIITHIHWALFILLEVISGFLIFQYNSYQGSVWFSQANTMVARAMAWEADALAYINLPKENAMLVRENLTLQHNLNIMRRKLADAKVDTSWTQSLQSQALSGQHLLKARVIANSVHSKDNYLTIDAGSAQGVKPEMGVVSGTGLVGIVKQVTSRHALVLSVLHSQSSISCKIRGTDYFGYLRWRGGNPLMASLDDVPRHAKVKVGDTVETSGFSSIFPEGLFVGKVIRVHDSADGMNYQLDIQLSTDLACIRHVNVIMNPLQEELDSLYRIR